MIISNEIAIRCLVSDDMGNRYEGVLVSCSEGLGKVLLPHGSVLTVQASLIFVSFSDLQDMT